MLKGEGEVDFNAREKGPFEGPGRSILRHQRGAVDFKARERGPVEGPAR